MAVIVLVGALTGCASQPRQPALTPDQWKSCADEELMIAYTASKVAPSSSKLWWQIAGQQIASECGTGGLAPAGRAAHILDAAEAMEQDFGRFVNWKLDQAMFPVTDRLRCAPVTWPRSNAGIQRSSLEAVELLLDEGADSNVVAVSGTPVGMAAAHGQIDVLKVSIERGGDASGLGLAGSVRRRTACALRGSPRSAPPGGGRSFTAGSP